MAHAEEVSRWLRLCPAHGETPLTPLPALASQCELAGAHIKAEWLRMGLSSFKAVGGAYAVATLVKSHAERELQRLLTLDDLRSEDCRRVAKSLTMACASAGNHGLSVTAGALMLGARAVVYLSRSVPEFFADRLRDKGARVVRSGETYEESMSNVTADAGRQSWLLVSDSSWPGYTEVPLAVMRGYTIILQEAALAMEAAGTKATHVFVQAGVGGLAAAAAGFLRERWGDAFKLIVVEPEGAPCLLESMKQGACARIQGGPTRLGRLDCKEPSWLAFDILSRLADGFMTIGDEEAEDAARRLASYGAPVSPCGAAGAAGLIAACGDDSTRRLLNLNSNSHVLLIGTE
jgi:diaminopropionate ammonia-lyase